MPRVVFANCKYAIAVMQFRKHQFYRRLLDLIAAKLTRAFEELCKINIVALETNLNLDSLRSIVHFSMKRCAVQPTERKKTTRGQVN